VDSQGIGLTGFSNTGFNYGLFIGRQYTCFGDIKMLKKSSRTKSKNGVLSMVTNIFNWL